MNAADNIKPVHEPSARSDAAYAPSVDTSPITSEAGESSRKWRPAPGELVSLWDMLRIYAKDFDLLMSVLTQAEEWTYSLLNDYPNEDGRITGSLQKALVDLFNKIVDICKRLELDFTLSKLNRMLDSLSKSEYLLPVFYPEITDRCASKVELFPRRFLARKSRFPEVSCRFGGISPVIGNSTLFAQRSVRSYENGLMMK